MSFDSKLFFARFVMQIDWNVLATVGECVSFSFFYVIMLYHNVMTFTAEIL